MRKLSKKLLLSILSVALVFIALGTTTFAWFSMNNTVNVTGMEVRTKVNDNLLIAASAIGTTAKEDDAKFKYGYIIDHTEALLEPVSSIDGKAFFYNNTKNVKADGDSVADTYTAYDHSNTGDFNTNYGTTGAVGYVEYVFQLKADNSSSENKDLVLSSAKIIYGTNPDASKAWRMAMFVDDMGIDGSNAANSSATTLVTILRPNSAQYFGDLTGSPAAYDNADKAVNGTTTLAAVDSKIDDAAKVGTVTAKTTHFYKVIVRLWLEGEDTTCNNTTFASLTDNWSFDLEFTLAALNTGAATLINNSTTQAKEVLTNATAANSAETNKVVDNVTYYLITDHPGFYTTVVGAITKDSIIYKIDANLKVTDVTNQCTLPTV